MKKKILVTSTDVMMLQFLIPHVLNLIEHNYIVEVACSNVDNRIEELKKIFGSKIVFYTLKLSRSPFKLTNIIGFFQLLILFKKNRYNVLWTNEPVMGIISRLSARMMLRKKIKILYIAHGFHFYKGASKVNWLIYFPIEKFFSLLTDTLVTINEEDYICAKKHFKHPRIVKFPGIGVNTNKFSRSKINIDILEKRKKIGVSINEILIIVVSELEERKNLETAIRAFSIADIENSKLIICGIGTQKEKLEKLIIDLNLSNKVHMLGYRYDIRELCAVSDLFYFTTYQEGLSVALMEAMSIGLPCVVSEIRGNVDLIEKDKGIYCNPNDVKSCAKALVECVSNLDVYKNCIGYNQEKIKKFDILEVKKLLIAEISMFCEE